MNRQERRSHRHEWTSKPSMPHLGTFCMLCGTPRWPCKCRCGCKSPHAIMGRPPFLCEPCHQQTYADLLGEHGPRAVNATAGDVQGPEGGPWLAGRCICGHTLAEHKQTIPSEVLCMTCFADPENYDGCETYVLRDANAI